MTQGASDGNVLWCKNVSSCVMLFAMAGNDVCPRGWLRPATILSFLMTNGSESMTACGVW